MDLVEIMNKFPAQFPIPREKITQGAVVIPDSHQLVNVYCYIQRRPSQILEVEHGFRVGACVSTLSFVTIWVRRSVILLLDVYMNVFLMAELQ